MINKRPYDAYFRDLPRRNDLLAPFLGGVLARGRLGACCWNRGRPTPLKLRSAAPLGCLPARLLVAPHSEIPPPLSRCVQPQTRWAALT